MTVYSALSRGREHSSIPPDGLFAQEAEAYTEQRRSHWDSNAADRSPHASAAYRQTLNEVYVRTIAEPQSVLEIGCGQGQLLAALDPGLGVGIDLSPEMIKRARARFPGFEFICGDVHNLDLGDRTFDTIVLSDVLNDLWDVQAAMSGLLRYCNPSTRIVANVSSHLWASPLKILESMGVISRKLPQNWLTLGDIRNLFGLSGFEVVKEWTEILMPLRIPVLAPLMNRYLAKLPLLRHLALSNFVIARPAVRRIASEPSVSVIVAARNEAGHVQELVARIPDMGSHTEIIFVEGNSTDNTRDVIAAAIRDNPQRDMKLLVQPGKGKGDAVRTGFDAAKGDILMILDADITVPPEDLPRFFEVLARGSGEFANGVRLVYPMEEEAMRFFNLLGNKFFSLAFSWLLGQPIRDTLCGTKVLWSEDYQRIARGRKYFGDFDPFGDFDLLFGAARQGLKIVEVPIRYRARRYGETNIQRWRHGWLLLKMVVFAARRIKFA